MTIKDVELQTGLARANIRYYEDQGFFSAARGENGYRNYSDENVDILLRVKLLRQLGFSLEEIHALQKGEQSLDRALAERESGLEAERRALDQALELCRAMRQEGADFYTLDARRYLDRLAREEAVIERDRDPVRLFPWRRYFARTLDLQLYSALITFALQLNLRINLLRMQEEGGTLLLTLAALAVMAGAEILMLHFWGATPGKALLGLKILREDGSRLSLAEAAARTVSVTAFFGGSLLLGQLPVPLCALAGLAMLIWACWQVYHERPLFWEGEGELYLEGSTRERAFWENGRNYFRVAGWLAAFAASIGLMVGGHFLAARPPHMGDSLTAEEFVDNYNQCMAFTYGEENLSRRLTVEGTFEDVERDDGTVIIQIMENDQLPDPVFSFGQGDGGLNQVTFTWEYDSGVPLGDHQIYMISIPYQKVYTAMRSFLLRRLGEREINALYEALVKAEGNLHNVQDGVEIHSEMRFSGYYVFDDSSSLLAEKGQVQSFFVEFSMELTE